MLKAKHRKFQLQDIPTVLTIRTPNNYLSKNNLEL
jgi:hypothetical protein